MFFTCQSILFPPYVNVTSISRHDTISPTLNEANASDVSGREKLERMGFDRFEVVVDDANHWAKVQPLDETTAGISP